MPQQQNQDILDANGAFNLIRILAAAHATTITVFLHLGFGSEALGFRGMAAALLLIAVFTFSGDPLYWDYFLVWLAALVCQRVYTWVMIGRGARVHSRYDGCPLLAMLLPIKESAARWLEPVLCFLASIGLGMAADDYQSPALAGLASWLFWGGISLGLDHGIYEALQWRRVQAMRDARMDQAELLNRYEESERR